MPAVVRVKRRIDEEPLGAFVLNGKKRRLDDNTPASNGCNDDGRGSSSTLLGAAGKDEISTILKFAGTMQSQDDNAISQLARLNKDEAQKLVQQKSRRHINLTERARQEMRQSLHENRFRVVNRLRAKLDSEETDDATVLNGEPTEITIVDIEKHAATTTQSNIVTPADAVVSNVSQSAGVAELTQPSDSDTGYVYDLYLPENEQQAEYVDLMDDDYLSFRPFDDLVYEDRFNDVDDEEYDSEDSNQENHFGNDYPDEDDDFKMNGYLEARDDDDDDDETEDARQMREQVEKFVFCDEDEDEGSEYFDQSSEDEDCVEYSDPYIHTVDADDDGFNNDIDYCDVDRYGMAYARYKARVLKRLNGDHVNNDDEDDDEDDHDELDEEDSQVNRKVGLLNKKNGEMHCD